MTEQEKFLAVETAEEAKKFIGRRIISTDGTYPGIREIIGWGEFREYTDKTQWLTWKEGDGWTSHNGAELMAGGARKGDGNWWINNSHITFVTYETEIEDLEHKKAIIEEKISELKKLYGKEDKSVEIKPAIRHLDLDD